MLGHHWSEHDQTAQHDRTDVADVIDVNYKVISKRDF